MSAEQASASTASVSVTQQIVEQVASAKSTSALELTPLYSVIDPDTLENIIAEPIQQGRIEFEYEGCLVRVDGDGEVTVTD